MCRGRKEVAAAALALWVGAFAPSGALALGDTSVGASDCGIARVDCPLGCFVAVRADRVTSVERKARELIEDYESGGRSCAYDCVEPGALECVRERCTTAAE